MNYITIFYRPIATYILIAINIFIFVIFSYSSKGYVVPDEFECIKNVAPECLEYKDMSDNRTFNEVSSCFQLKSKENLPADSCAYSFDKCLENKEIINKCISGEGKLYSKYGFAISSTGSFHPYTLITSIFVHKDLEHLFFNIFFLLFVGAFVENKLRMKKFLTLYFISGIVASLFMGFFYHIFGIEVISIGASGAIAGLLGANLVLNDTKQKGLKVAMIFGRFPTFGVGLSFLISFFILQTIYSIFQTNQGVGYIAHLSGFVAGFILAIFFRSSDNKTRKL